MRHKPTTTVAISPTEWARRHVISPLNSTNGLIVMCFASLADGKGRAPTTQRFVAEDMGKSLATIKRGMRFLLAKESGPVLEKLRGRGYLLVGYVDHDPLTCRNVECEAQYAIPLASFVQRAKAADRARRYRARKAAAAAAAAEGR